jgi:hypothetical protein
MRVMYSVVALAAAAGMAAPAAGQTEIYFAELFLPALENGSIQRMFVDPPSPPGEVLVTGGGLRSLDVDAAAGKVYWVDVDAFALRRANLDGTGQEDVLTSGLQFPSALRLDVGAGQAYIGDQVAEQIVRVDLTAPAAIPVLSVAFGRGLAVIPDHPILVYTRDISTTSASVHWYDLQNLGNGTVVQNQGKPLAVAVDATHGKVYWTDRVLNRIARANLDGTSVETVAAAIYPPRGIAVDAVGG